MKDAENFEQQKRDFVELMAKLKMHETVDEYVNSAQEVCPSCKHPVCLMVQKANKPLLCHLKYGDLYQYKKEN